MRKTTLILIAFVSCIGISYAQSPEKFEDYDWFMTKYIKYKVGKADQARELIYSLFKKADEHTGQLVLTFESDMGEWDHIAFFHLKNGPGDLNWKKSEMDAAWWKQVCNLSGSEENAKKALDEYNSYIKKQEFSLVRMRNMKKQLNRK